MCLTHIHVLSPCFFVRFLAMQRFCYIFREVVVFVFFWAFEGWFVQVCVCVVDISPIHFSFLGFPFFSTFISCLCFQGK